MKKFEILNVDRLEFLKKIEKNKVQLIITSPPYNIGKDYEKKLPFKKYLEEQKKTLKECYRVLSNKGSLCWQVGSSFEDNELIPLDIYIYKICKSLGFKLKQNTGTLSMVYIIKNFLEDMKQYCGLQKVIIIILILMRLEFHRNIL